MTGLDAGDGTVLIPGSEIVREFLAALCPDCAAEPYLVAAVVDGKPHLSGALTDHSPTCPAQHLTGPASARQPPERD